MSERAQINIRLDPVSTARLEALKSKLALDTSALVRLALARLAELEHLEAGPDPGPLLTGPARGWASLS